MKTSPLSLVFLLVIWGVAAGAMGASNLFTQLPPIAAPLIIGGLTVGFSLAVMRVRWISATLSNLGLRSLLAVHLVRFVGAYFLWLHAQGRMPAEFAQLAGWGDITAAVGALGLILMPDGPGFRRVLLGWNVIGAADLLVAVGTAGWLNFTRPGSMIEITQFPLALVPLFGVPVLFASHVYLFRRQVCSQTTESEATHVVPAF